MGIYIGLIVRSIRASPGKARRSREDNCEHNRLVSDNRTFVMTYYFWCYYLELKCFAKRHFCLVILILKAGTHTVKYPWTIGMGCSDTAYILTIQSHYI